MLGRFPDEKFLNDLMIHKEYSQVAAHYDLVAFIYFVSIVITAIIGAFIQTRKDEMKTQEKEEITDNDDLYCDHHEN